MRRRVVERRLGLVVTPRSVGDDRRLLEAQVEDLGADVREELQAAAPPLERADRIEGARESRSPQLELELAPNGGRERHRPDPGQRLWPRRQIGRAACRERVEISGD